MTVEELHESLLDEEQRNKLGAVLRTGNESPLREALSRVAAAAGAEYIEMHLGKQMPTWAAEERERRLYHLLRHCFRSRMPTEAEVLGMFQLMETSAARLLRDVKVKYRFEFEKELTSTVKGTLQSASPFGTDYRVVTRSENILAELKQVVA